MKLQSYYGNTFFVRSDMQKYIRKVAEMTGCVPQTEVTCNLKKGCYELVKVKLTVTRKELRSGCCEPKKELCGDKVSLPVEDVLLGIIHRIITEERGLKDAG